MEWLRRKAAWDRCRWDQSGVEYFGVCDLSGFQNTSGFLGLGLSIEASVSQDFLYWGTNLGCRLLFFYPVGAPEGILETFHFIILVS